MKKKTYLGDGCYVEQDEFGDIVLTTENGVEVTNRIVLEPEVYTALIAYVERLKAAHDHNKHCTADKKP